MGDNNEARMMAALGTVEMALLDAGIKIKPGSGVAAAGAYYRKTGKKIKKFAAPKTSGPKSPAKKKAKTKSKSPKEIAKK